MERRHLTISLPVQPTPQPRGRVHRLTVAPRGYAPVNALVGVPDDPAGLTLHFVGFNTAMGPWEAAKCAIWAALTQTTVVMCELPGFTRYGYHLPTRVRQDLMGGDPSSWAAATLACLKAATEVAHVPSDGWADVLAYSAGCSLAVAALPAIKAATTVRNLILVEPVSVQNRTIGRLSLHNTIDLVRVLQTVPRNLPSSWVRQAGLRQFQEPRLRFSPADFLALISMLSGDDTGVRLKTLDLPTTHIVRGGQSDLCPETSFAGLDAGLASREVPGATVTITGLGHQLWHALPAVDALARMLYGPQALSAASAREVVVGGRAESGVGVVDEA